MAANQASRRRNRGFTLIELIVAMVILATLAAIAIPSYTSYVLRSHRTEAKSALLDLASLEERYFSTHNSYSNLPTDLGYVGAANTAFTVGSGYYQITNLQAFPAVPPTNAIPGGTPATYTITATAVNQQANDTNCLTFSINSAGQQTATGGDSNASVDCWQQ
jgi:type IV pilus assembly protein PilE